MTSQIPCIAHTMFTCELTRIENPNEQQLGRKPARHDHLAWSEDPPFLRELYSLFPKHFSKLFYSWVVWVPCVVVYEYVKLYVCKRTHDTGENPSVV
uniref:SFRICE_023116 n=1 Tax=Spodoptera frugiperda TaxID=7108 RepID=A0A2H1WES1_SPOFR